MFIARFLNGETLKWTACSSGPVEDIVTINTTISFLFNWILPSWELIKPSFVYIGLYSVPMHSKIGILKICYRFIGVACIVVGGNITRFLWWKKENISSRLLITTWPLYAYNYVLMCKLNPYEIKEAYVLKMCIKINEGKRNEAYNCAD